MGLSRCIKPVNPGCDSGVPKVRFGSDAVLRTSPLGPVFSLNRTLGSAAAATPGMRVGLNQHPGSIAGHEPEASA
jgi:hypothetical protein